MNILRDFVIPAIIIILVLVMIAFWVMNCMQINNKKSSAMASVIVIASGVLIIAAILFVKLGVINRVGSETDRNTIQPSPTVPTVEIDPNAPISTPPADSEATSDSSAEEAGDEGTGGSYDVTENTSEETASVTPEGMQDGYTGAVNNRLNDER